MSSVEPCTPEEFWADDEPQRVLDAQLGVPPKEWPTIAGMVDDLGRPATIYTPPEVLRRDPNRWPTPTEFVAEWEQHTPADRLALAERLIADGMTAASCFAENHKALQSELARLSPKLLEETLRADREEARAEAVDSSLRAVAALLGRVEREQAAGDEWDVDEVVHDVRLAVLARSQAAQAPAEQEGWCVTHGSRWPLAERRCEAGDPWDDGKECRAGSAPSVRPATVDDEAAQ